MDFSSWKYGDADGRLAVKQLVGDTVTEAIICEKALAIYADLLQVIYLPPNTTPILQPMDQQVISHFKKLFTKHLLWCVFEVTESTNLTLREFWKDLYNIMICLRITDITVFFGGPERINSISIHFNGENGFDIRIIWVTSSVTERIKLVSQGTTVSVFIHTFSYKISVSIHTFSY